MEGEESTQVGTSPRHQGLYSSCDMSMLINIISLMMLFSKWKKLTDGPVLRKVIWKIGINNITAASWVPGC